METDKRMLYLARRLHLPSGDVLHRFVVRADDGRALEWYPFESERHSMLLVNDLYLFCDNTFKVEF